MYLVLVDNAIFYGQDQFYWLEAHQTISHHSTEEAIHHAGLQRFLKTFNLCNFPSLSCSSIVSIVYVNGYVRHLNTVCITLHCNDLLLPFLAI